MPTLISFPQIFSKKGPKKVLFVAPEAAPYVKVGGLGEIMRSFPMALRTLGYDARVMVPKYASMNLERFPMKKVLSDLDFVPREEDPHGLFVSNVLFHQDEEGVPTYFLENMEYFEKRANVYGYADDPIRWIYLSQATLEFIKRSAWKPDVIVANDWQTGFVPDFIKRQYAKDPVISKIASVFLIHNLFHQGMFDHKFVPETEYDAAQELIPGFADPRLLQLNGMRRGIMHADLISTVSPTYAKEILTPEFGEGLHELLREKKGKLYGVLNGIDYELFNPETDEYIEHNYSHKSSEKRVGNKAALQEKFNLEVDPKKFIIGIVSRMDEQKGFDLIMQIADPLFQNVNFQMAVVGSGDNKYRGFFQELEKKYPGRFGGHYFYDAVLPRFIFAGADVVLIPSRFEPSGLVQMEAMRYGAIPIVRETGGLADSVVDYTGETGDGFVFKNFDPFALLIAIIRAREEYNNKDRWRKLIQRAMLKDFSWERSAREYAKLFKLAESNREKIIKRPFDI